MNQAAESNQELQPLESGNLPATGQQVTTPMQLLQAAVDNNVDAGQLEKLMDLQERWEANQARKQFAEAMARFQAKCPRIAKTGRARVKMKSGGEYGYTYPKLDQILSTIQPHLDANGLSVAFSDFRIEGTILSLSCVVRHAGGHAEEFPFAVPVDEGMSINKMQQVGVSNSYCKRYALCNALNLVGADMDTDGNLPGDEPKAITDKQVVQIREHLEALEVDEAEFCKFLKVEDLESLPASGFGRAMNAINAKRRQVEKAQ